MSAADEIRKRIAETEAMIAKIDPVDSPTLMTIWKSELSMARECLAIVEREAAEASKLKLVTSSDELVAVVKAATTPQPDADGWIPWCGGECPVDADRRVAVKLRDWESDEVRRADLWFWEHRYGETDIIAYRIVKEPADA